MAFSSGKNSISLEDLLSKTNEIEIAHYYLGITEIPCVINSPLRKDNKPSFGLHSKDGNRIKYTDFATGEKGDLFDLLSQMWGIPFEKVLVKVYNDLITNNNNKKLLGAKILTTNHENTLSANGFIKEHSKIEIKIRDWRKYDEDYWASFGISISWLKYANVYPISHKIILKGTHKYVFGADKYAYAYIERKEGNTTLKIYQPFNKKGFKWCNNHDSSVISLWTKVPETGDKICICSSLKDALCLWANTGIPALAIQGEGYSMSNTAINELNRRFKKVYIMLDNDEPGIKLGKKLANQTGFINIVLPQFEGGKDISDMFKILQNKEQFKNILLPLFI